MTMIDPQEGCAAETGNNSKLGVLLLAVGTLAHMA